MKVCGGVWTSHNWANKSRWQWQGWRLRWVHGVRCTDCGTWRPGTRVLRSR